MGGVNDSIREAQMRLRKLPSPAMLVAICALIVGLTGSAVALQGKNSVKSNDIAPGAVKASDLHKLSVQRIDLSAFPTTPSLP